MPNDCNNSFTIAPVTTDQWKELAATFQVRDEGFQKDFLKTYFPEPDYAVTPVPRTFPESRACRAKTEEEKEHILKNEPTIREDSWWDWRVQNWGTKWDVYSCCNDWDSEEPSEEFCASFCTAWSPMNEHCMEVLSKQFPGAVLTNSYDEEGNDFCGVTVAKDGVVLDYCTEISKLRETWAKKNHPGLWEAAENPEEEDAVDELEDLWIDEMGEVVYNQLDAKEEELTLQVTKKTSVPTMTELVGQK